MEIQPNILATRNILCLLIGLPINQKLNTIIVNSSILIKSFIVYENDCASEAYITIPSYMSINILRDV